MTHTIDRPAAGPALPITGTHNFRSTAGYPAETGSIAPGALFRSDALHALDDAGTAAFAAHGIVRVIDLRAADEVRHAPSALAGDAVETVHHPIFDDAGLPLRGTEISLGSLYRYIVDERTERLASAVRLISDAPAGGVLVHCTAGKDRTGLVVAAALAAVGVPREHILADYAASEENLAGEWAERMVAGATAQFGELGPEIHELIVGSPASALSDTLDHVDAQHGGMPALLAANGVDAPAIERLRERLVATPAR